MEGNVFKFPYLPRPSFFLRKIGMSYDKLPGEWYGPTTVAYILRDLALLHRRQQQDVEEEAHALQPLQPLQASQPLHPLRARCAPEDSPVPPTPASGENRQEGQERSEGGKGGREGGRRGRKGGRKEGRGGLRVIVTPAEVIYIDEVNRLCAAPCSPPPSSPSSPSSPPPSPSSLPFDPLLHRPPSVVAADERAAAKALPPPFRPWREGEGAVLLIPLRCVRFHVGRWLGVYVGIWMCVSGLVGCSLPASTVIAFRRLNRALPPSLPRSLPPSPSLSPSVPTSFPPSA